MNDRAHSAQTVLVTGGAGYVGSHACKALSRAGFIPITFDNLSRGHREAVKWGPLFCGDLCEPESVEKAFNKYKPVAVMHFAALAYVGESVTSPEEYYFNNIVGSLNLLNVMKKHGVKQIVFSSTCATYGHPKETPITEQSPQLPINPYGNSKLAVERVLSDYSEAYGLRYAALRYFNAAGADMDVEIGEDHNPETHVIPLAIEAALGIRESFSVFGDDYDTPDGSAIRDYIHVADLADAHIAALKLILENDTSLAVNLGTGSGHSVLEIIKTVEAVTGRRISFEKAPRRAGDPAVLVADASKAMEILGWQPRYKDIREIVASAARWFEDRAEVPRVVRSSN